MPEPSPELLARLPLMLLGIALLATYLGLRTSLKVLGGANRGGVILLTTATLSVVAGAMGRPDLATHLPMAVAATALTLGVAFVLWFGPVKTSTDGAIVLPVAMACAAGYVLGRVDGLALLVMLLLGVVAVRSISRPTSPPGPAWPLFMPAVIGAVVGVIVAMTGPGLDRWYGHTTDAIVVSFLLAPVIVLPVAFECVIASKHDEPDPLRPLIVSGVACATVVPALAAVALLARGVGSLETPRLSTATAVDALMLLFASLIVAGVSLGVLKPGRIEAIALLTIYGAGLGAVLLLTHS